MIKKGYCGLSVLPHICLSRRRSAEGCIRFDWWSSTELLWILETAQYLLCQQMLQCEEASTKPKQVQHHNHREVTTERELDYFKISPYCTHLHHLYSPKYSECNVHTNNTFNTSNANIYTLFYGYVDGNCLHGLLLKYKDYIGSPPPP